MSSVHIRAKWSFAAVAIWLALHLFFIAVAAPAAGVIRAEEPNSIYATDEVVVRLQPGASLAEIKADFDLTIVRQLVYSPDIYLLRLAPGADPHQVIQDMHWDGRLVYAEPNFRGAAPEATGIDTYGWGIDTYGWGIDTYGWGIDTYGWGIDTYGWGIDTYGWPDDEPRWGTRVNPRQLYAWEWGGSSQARYYTQPAIDRVNLTPAQAISQGEGVVVAVLDTGVALNHPLLSPVLTDARYDFVDDNPEPADVGNGLDDNDNGFIDEMVGHGTHVAGIVHLVAPEAQIMPLRVLDSDGQGDSFIIAEAMLYAAAHGAHVVNLSLGTVWPSTFLQDVVDQLAAQGVVVVAAAGNLQGDIPQYPAASSCALAVTAVGASMRKADYASFGPWVDVAAPGRRIYSAYPGGYAWWSGTSMATPFVTGQAALLLAANPELTIEEVGQLIAGTAVDLDQQNQSYQGLLGAGIIDVAASLQALTAGASLPPGPLTGCSNH